MKKFIKILIRIFLMLIILGIVYVVLVVKKILPNPLLDTKDLVCSRETKLPGYVQSEIVVVEFNNDATIKNYKEIYKITYESVEELKKYKEYLDGINKKYQYDEKNRSIQLEETIEINKKNNYYKKTKKEMNDIILNELYYSVCE